MGHTPATADGEYTPLVPPTLYALDAETGELLWELPNKGWSKRREKALKKKTMIYTSGGPSLDRSFSDSPIAFGGKVYVRWGNGIAAGGQLAKNSGKV